MAVPLGLAFPLFYAWVEESRPEWVLGHATDKTLDDACRLLGVEPGADTEATLLALENALRAKAGVGPIGIEMACACAYLGGHA